MRIAVRYRIFARTLWVVIALFTIFSAIVYYQASRALKGHIGDEFHRIAEQMAARIDLTLRNEVEEWTVLTRHDALIEAVEQANRRYEGLSPQEIRSEFDRIDREWLISEDYRPFYTPSLNPTALLLSQRQAVNPEENAEIFVTDAQGALIAATNRTTDYWQADEGWWQAAFSEGRGAVYVGNLEFDDSAQVYAVVVALPVKSRDGTRAIGVLKVILNIHELMKEFAGYRLGSTGHINILDSSGVDLFESGKMPNRFPHVLRPEIVENIRRSLLGHLLNSDSEGRPFITGFAPVATPETLGPATFDGKQWYVLVSQNLVEAYGSVYFLMKTLVVLGLWVPMVIYLAALFTAKTITTPLEELRRGTQVVRDGDLGHRVELATGDELQELAESFNEMTARLQVSYEDLRKAREELQQIHQHRESLIESSTDAIIATDRDGNVVLFNKGAEAISGYRREEVLGRRAPVVYESDEDAKAVMRRMREGGGTVSAFETTFRAKDGSIIPVLISASLLYDEDGREAGTVGFSKDLRVRKQAEEELHQAHEELQQAYQSLEEAQASAIAAEKLAALGRLTAGVSHEILNPLTVITLGLYRMINDPDTHPETASDLRGMREQTNRITKIVQDLLYFTRHRPPERRSVDFNEAVKLTLGLVKHDLKLKHITVELNLAEELPPVSADKDQLQQVVLNLLTNARDAMMPDGGGRLSLRTETVQSDGRKFVELRVEDTGPGIPPQHMDKIFDPFFTTKPEGEGTGMGLSICKGIVDGHGGSLRAENVPGGGAAFIVLLDLEGE